VLAASLGRGYVGRHRLAQAALGQAPDPVAPVQQPLTVHLLPSRRPVATPRAPLTAGPLRGRASVAPWLRVVPAPHQPDQLADTLPHPVVTLLPLPAATAPDTTPASDPTNPLSAEAAVFALVDAERERAVTAELAAGADVRPYRPRHTA
jgi:hypothetical protein